jgi:hypothetical protein
MKKANKITLKLVRSFSVGFTVYSPKLNGLAFDINMGCFTLAYWGKGVGLFGYANYWHG